MEISEIYNLLKESFDSGIIDLKTETKIKEISLYKEILELNNLDSLSNMDKINLISNLIEVQSKIGNLSNISEENLNFNK